MFASSATTRSAIPAWVFWLVVAALACLGLWLRSGAVEVPFASDDYMQLGMLEGTYPGADGSWDLFHFYDPDDLVAHREIGTVPWWTADSFEAGILRPIPSLLLALDHAVAPLDPAFAHRHSLFWWLLAFCAAAMLGREALDPRAALLALAVFAVDSCANLPVAWVANRSVLVAACFGFLATALHIRGQKTDSRALRLASLLTFGLCAACGEYSLCFLGLLVGLELLPPAVDWKARARALAPFVGIGLLYLGLHRLLGYGTTVRASYVDPFDSPLSFLARLLERAPLLAGEMWAGVPADPPGMVQRFGPLFGADALPLEPHPRWFLGAAASSLVLAAAAYALRAQDDRAAGMALGSLLALIPVCAAPAHGRLTFIASFAAAAGLAAAVLALVGASKRGWLRWPAFAVLNLALVSVLFDARDTRRGVEIFGSTARLSTRLVVAHGLPGALERFDDKHVVVFFAPDLTTAVHGGQVLTVLGHARPRSWHALTMTPEMYLIRRVDAHTLDFGPLNGTMLLGPVETLYRPEDAPFEPGESYDAGPFEVTVGRTDADGRLQSLRLVATEPLDAADYVFVTATAFGLLDVPIPDVGKTAPLPTPQVDLPGIEARRLNGG